ncbi:hypothetical protein BS639_17205 [Rouxiella silvae]|uniref:Dit-like phage tail protein N-terminal domain-containing protein n=1 Tax=Rouxiella silvae TaxID=1646373 RepID=A0ABX3TXP9_9GAMM|nr:hypothetical protein [Rouxiella silvae]ORJ20032.1 hypothetical protein BS639_17205 [Rouxiella silvae]
MDILSTLFQQSSRKIDLIIPNVVVSEKHSDALEITEHPVEIGAPVADHAYKRPSEVTMEIGFAGGGSLLDGLDTSSVGLSLGTSPQEMYQKILDLQATRVPFNVITGKKKYSNMLIRGIDVTTDKTSENVLMCVLTLRQVLISQTQTVSVADKSDMANGVSTSAVQNSGVKTVIPTTTSILQKLATFLGISL